MSLSSYQIEGVIRCPCVKCDCVKFKKPEEVKLHLYRKEFIENYFVWTNHGEIDGSRGIFHNMVVGESSRLVKNRNHDYRIQDMVADTFGMHSGGDPNKNVVQTLHDDAKYFYEQLEETSRPLSEGSPHSELRPPGGMCHPSDGEAWKHFYSTYPDYASEPRNIQLGLCLRDRSSDPPTSSTHASDTHAEDDDPEAMHYDRYGRIIIVPEGNVFRPGKQTMNIITNAIKKLYDGPYATWTDFPYSLKEQIFNQFKCVWEDRYSGKVAANFHHKARKKLSDHFSDGRKKNKRPDLCLQHLWDDLLRQWKTEDFLQKSEKGKKARSSEKGGSLHTRGSISIGTIRRRLVIA
ncbi:uncharacterized protein [Nicotiana tomentosiformis]|uniref:uncharacterized protein n=1 Tax=Nicotiana tomentosiformis TaxID=4098 RepID=UPI00388CA1D7